MGMWPFRRKSNRRQSRGGAEIPRSEEETMHGAGLQREPGRQNATEIISTEPERRRSRRDSQKRRKSSRDSRKLQRRTYSFSPGRNDTIRVDTNRPPVPRVPSKHKGRSAGANVEKPEPTALGKEPLRASTQPPETTAEDWQRVPTLHKRVAQDLVRRKSSKKRKEEHDREAEIKAMVAFMPTRPAVESGAAGRPMKRESKKMHAGLNRNLQNPSSDISLPLAESIHSSLSQGSEHQASYKLTAFDMLAPRPTIRYSENPRYGPGASGIGVSDRSESRKRRISEKITIPEETLHANKRIDDLADNLDASELRELMERDQKRREKKKAVEKIKMEKKLARRQEKQREDEATAARNGTPSPPNMERGVFGRDVIGLGIGTSAVVTTSKRKGSATSDSGREKHPAEPLRQDSSTSSHRPFSDFQRSDSLASEKLPLGSDTPEPIVEKGQFGNVAKANVSPTSSPRGHTRGASSISEMMELARANKTSSIAPGQSSWESKAPPQSWTSFFKRSKTKQASAQSSFSNTSRDSMQSGLPPQIGYAPMRSTSNIPKRTMSKFREDLPELPISPPDSRVQSPAADEVSPIRTDYPKASNRASIDDPRVRYDTPTSGYRSLDAARFRNETPTSGNRSVEAPSPEPIAIVSQSLASIDSEGSWLSGRKGGSSKRGSTPLSSRPRAESAGSQQKRYQENSESTEGLGIAEDEYFSRLTPDPEQYKIRKQSAANPSSDEEDGGSPGSPGSPVPSAPSEHTKWGAIARHPTVVHREPRAKSTEGLLNEYDVDSSGEPEGETPQKMHSQKDYEFDKDLLDDDDDDVSLHRASSVDLGKGHMRHMSAGSAKLLELKKSADATRLGPG